MAPARLRKTSSGSRSTMTTAAEQQEEVKRREMGTGGDGSIVGGTSVFASFSFGRRVLRTVAVSVALLAGVFSYAASSRSSSFCSRREEVGLWNMTAVAAEEAVEEKKESEQDAGLPPKLSGTKLAELLQMDLEDIKQRMSALFGLIDTNKDDQIDQVEAKEWSLKLKNAMHQHQVQMEFQAIDKNSDGQVSFDELAATYVSGSDQKQLEEHKEEVQKRFTAVDKDGNHVLNLDEVMLLMDPGRDETLTQLEIDEILATQDKNKDAKITLEEFVETEGGNVSESEKQELQKEFSAYDLDKDGSIDAAELRKIIKDPHSHEIEHLLEDFMKDLKDGVLSKERWIKEFEKFAVSMLTDNGEALRYPEDYKGIEFPYSASTGTAPSEKEEKEHDEL